MVYNFDESDLYLIYNYGFEYWLECQPEEIEDRIRKELSNAD